MIQLVGGCASQAVCVFVSWTVDAAFAESDFWGKLDTFDSYMQSPFLERLPKIQSVATAWVFIYCVLPKENQERRPATVSRRSVQPHQKSFQSNCLFEFEWDSALCLSRCSPHKLALLRFDLSSTFCFFMFSSTHRKPRQGLLIAHYKTTMVIFLHTEDYCSPQILLLNLILFIKILLN